MIVLGDPNQDQVRIFQQGLLNTLSMLARQQLQNEYLQNQHNLQLKKQKKLLDYQQQLKDQERNKIINKLYGYSTPTIEELQPQILPNNPIDIQAQKFINPDYQQPAGLIEKFKSMLPQYEVGQTRIKGQFSDQFVNTGIPTAKDFTVASIYGVSLPKVEKPKVKFFTKIDTGDKVVPVIVWDNGKIEFNKEFYKNLSPKEKEEFKQRKSSLVLEVF